MKFYSTPKPTEQTNKQTQLQTDKLDSNLCTTPCNLLSEKNFGDRGCRPMIVAHTALIFKIEEIWKPAERARRVSPLKYTSLMIQALHGHTI